MAVLRAEMAGKVLQAREAEGDVAEPAGPLLSVELT